MFEESLQTSQLSFQKLRKVGQRCFRVLRIRFENARQVDVLFDNCQRFQEESMSLSQLPQGSYSGQLDQPATDRRGRPSAGGTHGPVDRTAEKLADHWSSAPNLAHRSLEVRRDRLVSQGRFVATRRLITLALEGRPMERPTLA